MSTRFQYERQDDLVRMSIREMTNIELHEIIIGMWARMPKDERVEIYKAMHHYLNEPGAYFSPVASAIARAEVGVDGVIDLLAMHEKGENVRA